MSAKWRWAGAGIALIGVAVMFFSIINSANEARENDIQLPTPELFLGKMEEIVGGGIIMFIGFAVIAIGRWLCRHSSM